jgi:hypothetical protein
MRKITPCLFLLLCTVVITVAQTVPVFCDNTSCYQANRCYSINVTLQQKDYVFAKVDKMFSLPAAVTAKPQITVLSACTLPGPATVVFNPAAGTVPPLLPDCSGGCKRPFMLLIHGGSFREGCRDDMLREAEEFARRGYVVGTIDYRLGWIPGEEVYYQTTAKALCNSVEPGDNADKCKMDNQDDLRFAQYKAIQDAHAALRFMAYYAEAFNINTSYMYVGGQSAGSAIAGNLAYMQANDYEAIYPGVGAILGPFNANGNKLPDLPAKLAGYYNNWGGLADTAYIKLNGAADRIPMIAFHGINDMVVPFELGPGNGCTGGELGTENGSKAIYEKLKKFSNPKLPTELYAVNGGHGIFQGDPQAVTEEGLKSLYRIQKAICFFRRVRQGDLSQADYINDKKNDKELTHAQLSAASPLVCNYTGAAPMAPGNTVAGEISVAGDNLTSVTTRPFITCNYTVTRSTQVTIRLYELNGRSAEQYSRRHPAGTWHYQCAQKLPPGVYLLTIWYDGVKAFGKSVAVAD